MKKRMVILFVGLVLTVGLIGIVVGGDDLTTENAADILADEIQQAQMETGEVVDMPESDRLAMLRELAIGVLRQSWGDGAEIYWNDRNIALITQTGYVSEFDVATGQTIHSGFLESCNTDATQPDDCNKSPQTQAQ